MRHVRLAFVVASIACAFAAAAPACKTPSQVTLDIALTNAKCQKDVKNTAITVGVEPDVTESRLAGGYVTATTTDCDVTSGEVGTLVVTPNDAMHASIIVTAAFGGADASSCRPPKYEHCIVARRRFAFVEHQKLTLPITLDVSCVDVPCDEVSTCKNGTCLDSEVTQSGDGFGEPSTPHDAGAGNGADSGGGEGGNPTDAGDAGEGGGGATNASCVGGVLHCADKNTGLDTACNGMTTPCCDSPANVATCGGACATGDDGWCCTNDDCKRPGFACARTKSGAGKCVGQTTCSMTALYCNGQACTDGQGCCTTALSPTPTCSADCATVPSCCSTANCTEVDASCAAVDGSTPGQCQGTVLGSGPPTCNGAALTCAGKPCDQPSACCIPSAGMPSDAVCRGGGSCMAGESQVCCAAGGTQCTNNQVCGPAMSGGAGNLIPTKPLGGVVIGGGGVSTCH